MKDIHKLQAEALKSFIQDPLIWFRERFPEHKLRKCQEQAFEELKKLINSRIKNAQAKKLTAEEEKYLFKKGISIMSGHLVGKDAFCALIVLYFLDCFPMSKVVCTAPTANQLKDALWPEISKWMRNSRKIMIENKEVPILEYILEWQAEKIYRKEVKGKEWFAVARTINTKASEEEQAETLSGRHEDFILFIIDEASGVPDPVFKPIEGSLAGKVALAIMIFNPTKSKCFAVRSQYTESSQWVTLHWNAEESEVPEVQLWVKTMQEKYPLESNTYRIRVKGLPPKEDVDVFIPWDWIGEAIEREIIPLKDDPIVKGVDFGAGGDKTVIITRHGGLIKDIKRFNITDSNILIGTVKVDFVDDEADILMGDVIGIGWAVMGRLREQLDYKIKSIDSRSKPINEEKYVNKRDEMYANLRKLFEDKAISIPNDRELIDQLGAIKGEYDSKGRLHITKKSQVKKTLGYSPDEADALALSFALPDRFFRKNKEETEKYKSKKAPVYGDYGWMAV